MNDAAQAQRAHHVPDQGHRATTQGEHDGHDHAAVIADVRLRFWVLLVLSVPILALSPLIQGFLGIAGAPDLPGANRVLLSLASIVFLFGGWPFLSDMAGEVRDGAAYIARTNAALGTTARLV